MSTFIEPLDLETVFLNYLAGSTEIFYGLALMVVATLGAKFRFPNFVMLTIFSLFAFMFRTYFADIYFLSLFITSIVIFYALGSAWSRT